MREWWDTFTGACLRAQKRRHPRNGSAAKGFRYGYGTMGSRAVTRIPNLFDEAGADPSSRGARIEVTREAERRSVRPIGLCLHGDRIAHRRAVAVLPFLDMVGAARRLYLVDPVEAATHETERLLRAIAGPRHRNDHIAVVAALTGEHPNGTVEVG